MITGHTPARLVAALVVIITYPASGQTDEKPTIVTICTGFTGHGYYLGGSLVDQGEMQGWSDDSMEDGRLYLLESPAGDPFIASIDATEKLKSPVQEGGSVFYIPQPVEGNRFVLVIYPNSIVETILFKLDRQGMGIVVWAITRSNGIIDKVSVMKGICARPESLDQVRDLYNLPDP
ncbi:MAG: hypothetical protein F4X69_13860 [Gemmatimonadetes bacterium]|nr:hypothetical protein [Gemmatimonadota bacterium]